MYKRQTIEVVGNNIKDTAVALAQKLMSDDTELITLYYGEEATEEEAMEIADAIREQKDAVEVEVEYGGQPIYYYFLSLE